jgi:hypothetical protein
VAAVDVEHVREPVLALALDGVVVRLQRGDVSFKKKVVRSGDRTRDLFNLVYFLIPPLYR